MTLEEFMKAITTAGEMEDTDAAAQAMSDLSDFYKNTQSKYEEAQSKYKTEHELRGKLALRIADGNLKSSELLTDKQKEEQKSAEVLNEMKDTYKFD